MKFFRRKPIFYWHVHHEILMEILTDPIKDRINFINNFKPTEEVGIRLRLLKLVRGKLPREVVKTGRAYLKAKKAFRRRIPYGGGNALVCNSVWHKYYKAIRANHLAISTLHDHECPDCPWDGTTIFPKRA